MIIPAEESNKRKLDDNCYMKTLTLKKRRK